MEPHANSRTHSWADPESLAAARTGLTGLEFMAAVREGAIAYPPSSGTLDFQILEFAAGTMTLSATPAEYQYNAMGTVHGGVVSTWLDSAMGYAIQTTLAAGEGFTTLDLNVRFIRPITATLGQVLASGVVEHRGRRTATARGELRDRDGRLLASATTTGMMFDQDPRATSV